MTHLKIRLNRLCRLIALGAFLVAPLNAHAQRYRPKPAKLLSQEALMRLGGELRPYVVSILRRGHSRRGITTLGSLEREGRGLRLTDHVILTADEWLTPSPQERAVTLEVRCLSVNTSRTHRAQARPSRRSTTSSSSVSASIFARSREDGWALLKLSAALGEHVECERPQGELLTQLKTLPKVDEVSKEPHLYASLRGYTVSQESRLPLALSVSGKASEPLNFYWLVSGRYLPGAPIFDQRGRWRSLVAGIGRGALDPILGPSQSLILPWDALNNALKAARNSL